MAEPTAPHKPPQLHLGFHICKQGWARPQKTLQRALRQTGRRASRSPVPTWSPLARTAGAGRSPGALASGCGQGSRQDRDALGTAGHQAHARGHDPLWEGMLRDGQHPGLAPGRPATSSPPQSKTPAPPGHTARSAHQAGPHLPATSGPRPARPGRLPKARPGGAASWRVRERGPTTGTAPSAPGPPARGPEASGGAAWRPGEQREARREAGSSGRCPCEAAGSWSGASAARAGPAAEFPFPGARPVHQPRPDTCDHRPLPLATAKSFWAEDRDPGSFPQSEARQPQPADGTARRPGLGQEPGADTEREAWAVDRPGLEPAPPLASCLLRASQVTWLRPLPTCELV